MQHAARQSRVRRGDQFILSSFGYAIEASYRRQIGAMRGASGRSQFDAVRSEWAHMHGLEPDDGAFLSELTNGPRTVRQLSDGLAVCGQTRDMVMSSTNRLLSRGVVRCVLASERGMDKHEPTRDQVVLELDAAETDLELARLGSDSDEEQRSKAEEQRVVGDGFRQALARVIAVRRLLATLAKGEDGGERH